LIVLGALLTLMNLCTEKLATIVFLQIEVQRKSLLHNYDIIIKRSFLGSPAKIRKGSFIWAALLSISLGLPLVLGIR
jgi:predicted LPLAT superfamily acyltransferase